MLTPRPRHVVLLVLVFVIGTTLTAVASAGAKKTSKGVKRKVYNVGRLARGPEVMQLADLIQHVIEPQSWMMVGGQGEIQMKGKSSITVQQTPEVQKQVSDLLAALKKLPSTKKKTSSRSRKKTKPILRIPVGKETKKGQFVVVYNVRDLIGDKKTSDIEPVIRKITTTIAPKTWAETGGEGVIEPFPKKCAVVVRQSKQVHEQLLKMLETATKQQAPKKKH